MASIKCAHCSGTHESVAEVRACAGVGTRQVKPAAEATNLTSKQQKFLSDLLSQLHLELDGITTDTISYQDGQPIITALVAARRSGATGKSLTLPQGVRLLPHAQRGAPRERTATQRPLPDVPAGHYAVPSLTGNNDLDFFRVDRPTKGQWAGRTFVKRVIGGRPDESVRGKEARAALEAILEFGTEDAALVYGTQLGQCHRCNRHLTDELSRALGIGPECRSRS